jgi:hypothetical protein
MLVLKKKRVIKQSNNSTKPAAKPTIIKSLPKQKTVIKKGGCCGRSSN